MNGLFFSCDWGTSSFRLRLVDSATAVVVAESRSLEGIAEVHKLWGDEEGVSERVLFYNRVLQEHIATIEFEQGRSFEGLPIVLSGMASSSIGLKELPYQSVPVKATADMLPYEILQPTGAFPYPVILVSGVRTERDVMRGEETQLAGCMALAPYSKAVYLFPGTHSKHVYVEEGILTGFDTYMTGEFFHTLSSHGLLAKSVTPGGSLETEGNRSAFRAGVTDSGENLLHASFRVRTNGLFGRFSREANSWYLSGLLIGSELRSLLQKEGVEPVLVAQGLLAASYTTAFEGLGVRAVKTVNGDDALVRAHAAIFLNTTLKQG